MEEQSKEVTVYNYQGYELRAKMIDGEPWFAGKDACQMLDIVNVSQAIGKLDEDEKGIYQIDTLGGVQSMLFVSLPGLQKLIFRSDKPEANKITRWVTHDVLPSIYATGSYVAPGAQLPLQGSFRVSILLEGDGVQGIDQAMMELRRLRRAAISPSMPAVRRQLQVSTTPEEKRERIKQGILEYLRARVGRWFSAREIYRNRSLEADQAKEALAELLQSKHIECDVQSGRDMYRVVA